MGAIKACLEKCRMSLRDVRGQSFVEYGLIVTGIALAVVAITIVFGNDTLQLFHISTLLNSLK